MTPVCPHVLNKSSVIFGGEDVLEVRMTQSRSGVEERVVTFDGTDYINLVSGDIPFGYACKSYKNRETQFPSDTS